MPYLVICNYVLFMIGHDGVFLLVACYDDLDALFKIGLTCKAPSVTHGTQGRFINDVCKLCAGGAGGHARDLIKINILGYLYLLGVDLEDLLPALEVGKLNGNAAVKAAGARERRVERFGAVCCGKDYYAVIALKAIHLGEKLIKRLLALIVSAKLTVTLLADSVDLVDENYTGCFFLCLLEQIAHLARTHADKHLDKLGAGHREKRNIRFAGYGLSEHGLAGSRRADKQYALGH